MVQKGRTLAVGEWKGVRKTKDSEKGSFWRRLGSAADVFDWMMLGVCCGLWALGMFQAAGGVQSSCWGEALCAGILERGWTVECLSSPPEKGRNERV